MTTHYSNALSPKKLIKWADTKAEKVFQFHKQMNTKGMPVFCYTGLSGIALATALSNAIARKNPKFQFNMMYVRKDKESSHGSSVEYWESPERGDYFVFVDDFIDCGNTMRRVCNKLREFMVTERLKFRALCLENYFEFEHNTEAYVDCVHVYQPEKDWY